MKSLVLGGTKSGKSRYAETLADASSQPVTVIATARADDKEMVTRIQRHQADRNSSWHLVEEPLALGAAICSTDAGRAILVDCLTLWITNLLLLDDPSRLEIEKSLFLDSVVNCKQRLIIVSNETNMGIVPLGELSRQYCDEVGVMHQALAEQCDDVVLIIAGLAQRLKPACS